MKSREHVLFDDWKEKSLLDFWRISQEFLSADSDFIELLDRLSYQIKRGKLKSRKECDQYLFNSLIKELGKKSRSSKDKIYLLALFRLHWSLEKLSWLTKDYISKIKFVILQLLKERIDTDILNNKMTNDCCRTELYLLDYLFEREKSLKPRRKLEIEVHLESCLRCKVLWEKAQSLSHPAIEVSAQTFNYSFPYATKSPQRSSQKIIEFYKNMALHWKSLLQISLAFILLGVMTSVPFFGKYLLKSFPSKKVSPLTDEVHNVTDTWVDLSLEKDLISPPWMVSDANLNKELNDLGEFLTRSEGIILENKSEVILNRNDSLQIVKNHLVPKLEEIKTKAEIAREADINDASAWTFYRWGAYADDLSVIVPKILQILEGSGVEKAGELELGAEYRGGRYFHFSVKKVYLQNILNEMSKMKLEGFTKVEAKSDRKNKEGYSRVVFLLKQK